jgi:hypothetical protein
MSIWNEIENNIYNGYLSEGIYTTTEPKNYICNCGYKESVHNITFSVDDSNGEPTPYKLFIDTQNTQKLNIDLYENTDTLTEMYHFLNRDTVLNIFRGVYYSVVDLLDNKLNEASPIYSIAITSSIDDKAINTKRGNIYTTISELISEHTHSDIDNVSVSNVAGDRVITIKYKTPINR